MELRSWSQRMLRVSAVNPTRSKVKRQLRVLPGVASWSMADTLAKQRLESHSGDQDESLVTTLAILAAPGMA